MAPLPPNNTTRYELQYTDGIYKHSLLCRVGPGISSDIVIDAYDALLTAFDDYIGNLTVLGLLEYPSGGNISFEIPWTLPTVYGSASVRAGITAPYACVFTGRTVLGRRTKLAVFGPLVVNDDSYKVNPNESGVVGLVHEVLSRVDGCFLAIDGAEAVWHNYMLITPFHDVIEKRRNG